MMKAICEILEDVFHVPIDPTDTIETVDEWDSLGHLQAVMALEDAFGMKFYTNRIPALTTVSEIYQEIIRMKR